MNILKGSSGRVSVSSRLRKASSSLRYGISPVTREGGRAFPANAGGMRAGAPGVLSLVLTAFRAFRTFVAAHPALLRWAARTLGVAALGVAACNLAVLLGGTPFAARLRDGEKADCILVLGARVYADGTVSPVLEDRLQTGLRLYREGRASRILVSGDHGGRDYDEVNAMRRWLESRGVPAADIFQDHAGLDTYSSLARARDVFGAQRVLVVTQRFHLPRALFIARRLGLQADGAAADLRVYRGAAYWEAREVASRTRAFVDVAVGRRPRHLGVGISLAGDGRATRG